MSSYPWPCTATASSKRGKTWSRRSVRGKTTSLTSIRQFTPTKNILHPGPSDCDKLVPDSLGCSILQDCWLPNFWRELLTWTFRDLDSRHFCDLVSKTFSWFHTKHFRVLGFLSSGVHPVSCWPACNSKGISKACNYLTLPLSNCDNRCLTIFIENHCLPGWWDTWILFKC